MAINPVAGSGWKVDPSNCEEKHGDMFTKCLENSTFSADEIIVESRNFKNINTVFSDYYSFPMVQMLFFDTETTFTELSTYISLMPNLTYFIGVYDSKIEYLSTNPDTIPRSFLKLEKNAGIVGVFLKVRKCDLQIPKDNLIQAIRHEKLNTKTKPCEPSSDYNFSDCVEKSILTKAGCQPPWRKVTIEEMPLCDNATLLLKYHIEYSGLSFSLAKNHNQ